jgi:hypothetical protein
MAFEQYFTVEEICARIPRSPKFFRAEIQRGHFSPGRLADGTPDLRNIQLIDDTYMVPLSGICHYLANHAAAQVPVVAELVAHRLRPEPESRPVLSDGCAARSPGELRRKHALQTHGPQEAAHV